MSVLRRLKSSVSGIWPRRPPGRILLLLTNPRAGSTWLLDSLRAHPAIRLEPHADVWRRLRLEGRRYPRDLSNTPGCTERIEVQPGRWERIPSFGLEAGGATDSLPPEGERWAVEKLHPHFFGNRTERFDKDLGALGQVAEIKIIYLVRHPAEAFASFRAYQTRNPDWNPHISASTLPGHLTEIFESIHRLVERRPGLVIDYQSMRKASAETLGMIFAELWPGVSEGDPVKAHRILDILDATSRRRRVEKVESSFLGPIQDDRPSPAAGERTELSGCIETYHRILASQS